MHGRRWRCKVEGNISWYLKVMNCMAGEKRTAFTSAAVATGGRLPWQPYLLAINHLCRSDWDAVPTNTASHSTARLDFGGTSHDCSGLNSNVHVPEVLTVQRYYWIYIRKTVTSKVNPAICMDFLFRQLCRCITKVLCWQEQLLAIKADTIGRVIGFDGYVMKKTWPHL